MTRFQRQLLLGTLLGGALVLGACDDPGPAAPISDDTFVTVYVELRTAALTRSDGQIPPEERDRILEEHGVEAEDLIRFVEVHGEDLRRMEAVWERIDTKIQERRMEYDRARQEAPGL